MSLQNEHADLLTKVKDYYKRRNVRNAKGVASAIAGVGVGMQTGNAKDGLSFMAGVMRPGSGPQKLTPKEVVDAKRDLFDVASKYQAALSDKSKPFVEQMKAAAENEKVFMDTLAKLYGSKTQSDGTVKSSYNGARAGMTGDLVDFIQKGMESANKGNMSAGLKHMQEARAELQNSLAASAGFEVDESTVRAVGAMLSGTDGEVRVEAVAQLQLIAEAKGVTPEALQQMFLDAAAAAPTDGGVETKAAEIAHILNNEGEEAKAIVQGATVQMTDVTNDQMKHLAASGAKISDVEVFAETLRRIQKQGGGGAEALESLMEDASKMGEMDPDMKKKWADALDSLDEESQTYDPTLAQVRDDLFKQPAFTDYMRRTGITDPQVALKELRREARGRVRQATKDSREAATDNNEALRAGKNPAVGDTAAPLTGPVGEADPSNVYRGAMATRVKDTKGAAVARTMGAATSGVKSGLKALLGSAARGARGARRQKTQAELDAEEEAKKAAAP